MSITVTPDPFVLVDYDAAVVRSIVDDVAAQIGWPAGVDIVLTVDEGLPHPILGTFADVVDGRAELWCSGGNFEARDKSRGFSEPHARAEITHMLLRAHDRLGDGFAGAPSDAELTLAQRATWDTWTWGRLRSLGHNVHEQKRRYDFRMQHGFTDAADAAFERAWNAPTMTWAGICEICAETGADQRVAGKVPVDLLRRS